VTATRISADDFPLVWRWRAKLADRHGQPCRITVRGRLGTVRVEFPDGFFVFTSWRAVRRG